ncbi:hypothetical protein NPIL_655451 [Nephila pilipes]|uniref:C2H2-type domain-containing protein n=1 Tax=Nephila pilipes TaxID=299642 RepID=A0A8X6JQ95_NEPPI|nr:hypothetical protein NPIL_655451 [Nephila pilipes]
MSFVNKSFIQKVLQSRSIAISTNHEIVVPLHACSYCSYSTPYKTTLINHVRIHTGTFSLKPCHMVPYFPLRGAKCY